MKPEPLNNKRLWIDIDGGKVPSGYFLVKNIKSAVEWLKEQPNYVKYKAKKGYQNTRTMNKSERNKLIDKAFEDVWDKKKS